MNGSAPSAIGIDVGGTKVLGVAIDRDGQVLHEHRVPSAPADGGVEPAIEAVFDSIVSVVGPPLAVGIGIAGLVDSDGRLRYGPNLPNVLDLPVRARMEALTGLAVHVDNDANAAGFGEATFGAARGARHAIVVTLGTGIGGALVVDGALYRGAAGFAGEIGHFTVDRSGPPCACGAVGHWEAVASGSALGRLAAQAAAAGDLPQAVVAAGGDPAAVDGHHLVMAARDGNAAALAVIDHFAENVAIGLAALANILDPERIVVAGGLVEIGPLLLEPVVSHFARHLEGVEHRPEIPVVAASLGERAGAIGAAAQALHAMTARSGSGATRRDGQSWSTSD